MTDQRDISTDRSTPPVEHSLPFTHPSALFPYLILLLSTLSLIGWIFHIPVMTSALPHFSTMKPNTALSLGMLAVCCRARSGHGNANGHLSLLSICGLGGALVVSCGTVLEYALRKNLGIDNLFLGIPLDRFDDAAGRMALGTAVCLALIGCSLALIDRAPRSSVWMLLTANMIALSDLLLFFLNGGPPANISLFRSMSVPTALALLMLAVAALASRPDRQPVLHMLQSVSGEGRALRRLLIFVILPLLTTVPSVVALRGNIPEAFATLFILGILLLSAQTWNSYRQSQMPDALGPVPDTK